MIPFNDMVTMLLEGTRDTLYMTLVSTLFGYIIGLPVGILLTISDKDGIRPQSVSTATIAPCSACSMTT